MNNSLKRSFTEAWLQWMCSFHFIFRNRLYLENVYISIKTNLKSFTCSHATKNTNGNLSTLREFNVNGCSVQYVLTTEALCIAAYNNTLLFQNEYQTITISVWGESGRIAVAFWRKRYIYIQRQIVRCANTIN